ncbi:DUF559 domain-containing protein [bacterium]|nr:DUF559 domain-containing protein [bacterium]
MRKGMTPAESKLRFAFLRKYEYKFLRQKCIDHFVVDFYCAKVSLVIEIDGETHADHDAQEYDTMRTELLDLYGLHIIRFSNDQIYHQLDDVCRCIADYCDGEV